MITNLTFNDKTIYRLMQTLLLLLGVTQLMSLGMVNIAISAIIAIIMCMLPVTVDVVVVFLLAPFFNLFSVQIGTTSMFYVFALIYIFKLFKYNHWKLRKGKVLLIIIAITLTLFWMDVAVQLKWLVLFTLLVFNYKDPLFIDKFPVIVKQISISTITSSVIGYIMLLQGKSIYTQSYIYSALGNTTRFAGLIGDSVFCGQFLVIVISLLLCLALEDKLAKSYCYLATGIISYFVIITFSRTAIVLLAFVLLLYFIAYIAKNIHNKRTVHRAAMILALLCGAILGGISYVTSHMDNPVISKYVIRFSTLDLWTGRTSVTENYIEKFTSSISHYFIGMTYDEYTMNGVRVGETIITRAHNIYLETICLFGLCAAVVVFAFCLIRLFKYLRNNNRIYMSVPFITLLASGVSLHGHLEWPFYFLVALCLGVLDYYEGRIKKERLNEI